MKIVDRSSKKRRGPISPARPASKITAVILAAGRGARLERATCDRPKCLLEVGGVPLLEHQLDSLASAGVDDVFVVVGYMADAVRDVAGRRAQYVYNLDWARTNSLYSLGLCSERIGTDMLVMNCDVLAHADVVYRLLRCHDSAFAVDTSSGNDDEHMKVELLDGFLVSMSKKLPRERTHGENVGVLYFEAHAARVLFREAGDLLRAGGGDLWLAAAVERTARHVPLRAIDVADLPWVEIDFPEDLTRARCDVFPKMQRLGADIATRQRRQLRSHRDDLPSPISEAPAVAARGRIQH